MKKVYIGNENTVTLKCPHCEKTKVVDTTKYEKREGLVKIKITFKCRRCYCGAKHAVGCNGTDCKQGHTMVAWFERRIQLRKKVNLPGKVIDKLNNVAMIKVRDISQKGLMLQVVTPKTFEVGEILTVLFALDDPQNTEINKKIVIRKMRPPDLLGVEFTTADTKTIGFYLER